MAKERFEVTIPARIYIINDLKEARKILEDYKGTGITIRRIKEEER